MIQTNATRHATPDRKSCERPYGFAMRIRVVIISRRCLPHKNENWPRPVFASYEWQRPTLRRDKTLAREMQKIFFACGAYKETKWGEGGARDHAKFSPQSEGPKKKNYLVH